jgi:hypothetical protein
VVGAGAPTAAAVVMETTLLAVPSTVDD